uniref:Uncharacterized protein n=1 Tax=Pseudomonas aeruginosa TaxID=287 RepID=A0A7S5YGQ5_PSEAI|nr:hypothetical protein [Pseudomonas aeruginosa]
MRILTQLQPKTHWIDFNGPNWQGLELVKSLLPCCLILSSHFGLELHFFCWGVRSGTHEHVTACKPFFASCLECLKSREVGALGLHNPLSSGCPSTAIMREDHPTTRGGIEHQGVELIGATLLTKVVVGLIQAHAGSRCMGVMILRSVRCQKLGLEWRLPAEYPQEGPGALSRRWRGITPLGPDPEPGGLYGGRGGDEWPRRPGARKG